MFKFKNNAKSLLAAAISNTDLVFSVTGGEGALFPSTGNFRVTLVKATGVREIVEVESRSTDAFTVMAAGRGLEGTTAQTYSAGDVTAGVAVRLSATAGVLERLIQRLASTYQVVLDCTGLTADRTIVVPNQAGTLMLQGDATYGFTTGDAKLTIKTVADTGWVMANDGTIGNAASGGTTRANADTAALYTLLWNNISNTYAAVSTGRGANAAADFAANKTIALPKALGRALAVSGAGAGLTARALGENLGHEALAQHTHGITDPGHFHNAVMASAGGNGVGGFAGETPSVTDTKATGITINNAGTGDAGNMQPTLFLNVAIKL